jgi:hypothetical protein
MESIGATDEEQDLLPRNEQIRVFVKPSERPFQDTLFLYLYVISLIVFLVSGFQHLKAPSFDHYELIFFCTFVSVVLSILWLLIVTRLSKLIYISALSIPLVFAGLSIYTFFTPLVDYTLVKTSSGFGFFFSMFTLYKAIVNKHKFELLSRLWSMTTVVLYEHPSIFVLSLFLSLLHILFSLLWLWTFGHLFSVKEMDAQTKCWILFHLIFYFWTSACLKNMEKAVVGSIVGQWYFESEEDEEDEWDLVPRQNSFQHLQFVGSRSFGSVSLASLLLGGLYTIDFVVRKVHSTKLSIFRNRFATFVLNSLKSFCERYTGYVVTFIGISGSSFGQSALGVTKLFRRHLVFGLSTSLLSSLISFMGKFLVSSATALFVYSVYGLREDMGYHWVFFISTVVPYYVLNICTHAWEST